MFIQDYDDNHKIIPIYPNIEEFMRVHNLHYGVEYPVFSNGLRESVITFWEATQTVNLPCIEYIDRVFDSIEEKDAFKLDSNPLHIAGTVEGMDIPLYAHIIIISKSGFCNWFYDEEHFNRFWNPIQIVKMRLWNSTTEIYVLKDVLRKAKTEYFDGRWWYRLSFAYGNQINSWFCQV